MMRVALSLNEAGLRFSANPLETCAKRMERRRP
jgi:hypothetical protein